MPNYRLDLAPADAILTNANMSLYDGSPLKVRSICVKGRYPRLLDIVYELRYYSKGTFCCASNPSDILFGLLGAIYEDDQCAAQMTITARIREPSIHEEITCALPFLAANRASQEPYFIMTCTAR